MSEAFDPSWIYTSVNSLKVSKWRWLWRQFLCVCRLSKKPTMLYGLDASSGEDLGIEVGGFINEHGDFEINYLGPPKNSQKN